MLSVARAFVEAVCHSRKLDANITFATVLATGEALTNIVRHAHKEQPGATICVHLQVTPDSIEIELYDEGPPFDLGSVPNLDPGELRVGGRGVYLMRSLMDELDCRPRAEGGNTLFMRKRFGSASTKIRDCG